MWKTYIENVYRVIENIYMLYVEYLYAFFCAVVLFDINKQFVPKRFTDKYIVIYSCLLIINKSYMKHNKICKN